MGYRRALDLLKTVLAEFDYRDLDELAEFRGCNTATEFLAYEVHKRMARRIKEGALGPQAITSLRVARLSQLDSDLGNFADGLNGNWLIGLVRSRKNSGKAAAVPTK